MFEGQDNQRQALVRCTLDGRCERTTEIVRAGLDTGTALALPRSWFGW